MNRLALTALATIAAAGLLVGCDSKTPGTATTAPGTGGNTGSPTSTSASSSGEAPPVTGTPLSLDKFKTDPCTLLTPEQITQLGDMKPGEKRDRSGQPQCIWHPKAPTGAFSFTYTFSKSTLNDYYKGKSNYPYFKPAQVSGYPAASFDGIDGVHGDCSTVVALSDKTALMVQVNMSTKTAPNYSTPCTVSEKGAAIAIEGLK
ncbi:hypothetical protein Lesp02_43290 [Lentzea sp. NBRC 105346]|uniref:DUF3558 domain-containing protein n=1 Tax=Lentzea sp. NBRC 105346 TaxID=3032205 RepID=UPI0024A1618F|nr:DUF3558 domain-containing protein [Lentzea sp. NBRC 105346]GLZ32141.1 hypothetical protein Lesp02_43290 [Lentzea sp. NBRC 105346]